MGQHRGILTREEQARITELQDLLIDRFVEHREATAAGQEERVATLEAEIDNLLREKKEIKQWALAGSAQPPPTEAIEFQKNRIGDPALAGYGRKVHRIG